MIEDGSNYQLALVLRSCRTHVIRVSLGAELEADRKALAEKREMLKETEIMAKKLNLEICKPQTETKAIQNSGIFTWDHFCLSQKLMLLNVMPHTDHLVLYSKFNFCPQLRAQAEARSRDCRQRT